MRHSEANDLDLFDFSSVLKVMATEREERKNAKEEEKLRKKMIKAEMDRYYAFAIVDGTVEKVNGYQIEPPKLFRGRGIHPKAGLLKPRIQP